MSDDLVPEDEHYAPEQLVLSDLINRVLDKGVVIRSEITIAIADIDLVKLDLRLLLSSVATLQRRIEDGAGTGNTDLPVRPVPGR